MLVGMKAYSIAPRQKILRACDQRLGTQRAIATLIEASHGQEQARGGTTKPRLQADSLNHVRSSSSIRDGPASLAAHDSAAGEIAMARSIPNCRGTEVRNTEVWMEAFVRPGPLVQRIWDDLTALLLIFAGAAAEFALNRPVDWLFVTGVLPRDPSGRLFATAAYAQDIAFADVATARVTLAVSPPWDRPGGVTCSV